MIDYSDFVISPGLVDIHVHLNEPGREAWEGFDSGTRAAAAGGVTSLVDMPLNSAPAVVDAESFDLKLDAARGKLHVDVAFWGGLVPSNARNPAALGRLLDRGVVGLKAFMSPSGIDDFQRVDEDDLRSAIRTLERHQVPLMAHAELPGPVVEDPGADPRKYATYLATRPRKWERVRAAKDSPHRPRPPRVFAPRAFAHRPSRSLIRRRRAWMMSSREQTLIFSRIIAHASAGT